MNGCTRSMNKKILPALFAAALLVSNTCAAEDARLMLRYEVNSDGTAFRAIPASGFACEPSGWMKDKSLYHVMKELIAVREAVRKD